MRKDSSKCKDIDSNYGNNTKYFVKQISLQLIFSAIEE